MTDVITVRGTGEGFNNPANMLTNVTRYLDPSKCRVLGDCSYPAAIGPAGPGINPLGPSEDDSVNQGVANLANLIRSTPNRVGVLGYSLGAIVVSRFLEAKAHGEYADCELAWSGCVANPVRVEGDSIDPNPVGYGIAGQHGPFPDIPHFEAANPADGITSCPADSPLRALADGMSAFSFATLGGWTTDLADKLCEHRFQPTDIGWWQHPIRTWNLYATAGAQMYGYLSGQTHIRDYIDGGYCRRLADRINALS